MDVWVRKKSKASKQKEENIKVLISKFKSGEIQINDNLFGVQGNIGNGSKF